MADPPTASTPTPAAAAPPRAGPLATLGWAGYLACSWTWCIGMFLPVLLVRDYGVWGFVVFAVPNVVGAGAMGWVLRDGASERIVRGHDGALAWFMRVTLLFQWYFAGWVAGSLHAWWAGPVVFLGSVLAFRRPAAPLVALSVWLASAACGAGFLLTSAGTGSAIRPPGDGVGLPWLAPVCLFGFALCPYLDYTFHKARRSQGHAASKASFTLGFGIFFAAMILFTLAYTRLMPGGDPATLGGRGVAGALVLAHIALQLGFTTAAFYDAHACEDFDVGVPMRTTNYRGWDLMAFILISYVVGVVNAGVRVGGYDTGEVIYRVFIAFYGLVFPAYVWLCMIPTADGHSGTGGARGRLKLGVLAGAVTLAAPCYWMGFIERREWWLGVGLGVVLLARLLVRGKPTGAAVG